MQYGVLPRGGLESLRKCIRSKYNLSRSRALRDKLFIMYVNTLRVFVGIGTNFYRIGVEGAGAGVDQTFKDLFKNVIRIIQSKVSVYSGLTRCKLRCRYNAEFTEYDWPDKPGESEHFKILFRVGPFP